MDPHGASPSRREFFAVSAAAMIAGELTIGRSSAFAMSQPRRPVSRQIAAVKALVFDTFGTVVDWRTSVTREVNELAKRKGFDLDGAKFADAWRAGYHPSMERVRRGELPWTKLDKLHRMTLDKLLADFGIRGLAEGEVDSLNRAWHRLQPWPDSVAGLTRLKRQFIIAPLSNGNVSLMTDMAKYSGLPWDCILGAELARHYKPDREVYLSAAEILDLKPHEVMMVAAHSNDLEAASSVGLRTAFVTRPNEFGPGGRAELKASLPVDVSAADFTDLASQCGA
jgi:2-haloacid dehalogenase